MNNDQIFLSRETMQIHEVDARSRNELRADFPVTDGDIGNPCVSGYARTRALVIAKVRNNICWTQGRN